MRLIQEGVATQVPTTVPTALPNGTSPAGQQSIGLAAILALFIYLGFFGTIGYRRGATRELITLAVSLGMYFVLQQFSAVFVSVADKFGKGVSFLFGQEIPTTSALGAWAAANTSTYLLSIWLVVVLLTYVLTSHFVRNSKKDGWAVLYGIGNGLVFATVFAPLLTALIFPGSSVQAPATSMPILGFLANIWQQMLDLVARLWVVIQPNANMWFFLSVVLLVLLAAFTLRSSAKPKAKT